MTKPYLRIAALAAVPLLLTACGSGTADDGASPAETGDKTLTAFLVEPTSLVPQMDTGTQVGMAMCANLMEMNAETLELEPLVAESIDSDDNQHWTIKLKDWTFQDGTPVTASSYVDAWNATAYAPNALGGNGSMQPIQGYADLNPADGSTPKTKTLSGLKAVDDKTIEITTTEPNGDLPMLLSSNPFCPLPESYYEDPEAYGQHPISNGPYEFESWDHNEQITLKKWDDFPGDEAAFGGGADTFQFKIYTDIEAAYTDFVAGNLDLIRAPDGNMVERAKADVGEQALFQDDRRHNHQFLAFPAYLDKYKDVNLRRAISQAIDREAIVSSVLKGHGQAADAIIPPEFETYREGVCDACAFDPDAAKASLAKAEANGFDGSVKIIYSTSPANDQVVEAISNQLQTNLGIKVEIAPGLGPEVAEQRSGGTFDGIYFGGWGLSYASEDQFLSQYVTHADGNDANAYSNPEVDALEAKALAAPDEAERAKNFQLVEDQVVRDLPVTPLYWKNVYGLQSEKAQTVSAKGDIQMYRAKYVG
ncbi:MULTISPECIES: peptide ABC transporter substrate-binding protein [unclassified Isoptericola]|uniref:peptide ABC transporter substrate-binding protein n=1 Tax=unclassified Isoptericola TaxID=2623355 RepID=UPI0036543F95